MKNAYRVLLLFGVLAGFAHAQTEELPSVEIPQSDAGPIEEVEVYGRKRPRQMEKIVIKARLDFWELYNSVNTIDEFQVECAKRKTSGSNLKKLRCEPKYFT
ncbi:MAG: hypothetical protein AAFX85_16825, partial [Pseudomonadota bacterium]